MEAIFDNAERLVSATLTPDLASIEPLRGPIGEPSLPMRFRWKKEVLEVAEVVAKWKELGACTHGSNERYLRKHWYELRLNDGRAIKVYFERKPRSSAKARWHLYSVRGGQ